MLIPPSLTQVPSLELASAAPVDGNYSGMYVELTDESLTFYEQETDAVPYMTLLLRKIKVRVALPSRTAPLHIVTLHTLPTLAHLFLPRFFTISAENQARSPCQYL